MLGRHTMYGVLGAQHRPDDVGLHHLEQAKLRHLLDPRRFGNGCGIVDQSRNGTQFAIDPVEQADHLILVTGIGTYGDAVHSACTHLGQYGHGRCFVGQVVDAHAITLPGSKQRGGSADTATAPSDDNDLGHGPFVSPNVGMPVSASQRLLAGAMISSSDGFGLLNLSHRVWAGKGWSKKNPGSESPEAHSRSVILYDQSVRPGSSAASGSEQCHCPIAQDGLTLTRTRHQLLQ